MCSGYGVIKHAGTLDRTQGACTASMAMQSVGGSIGGLYHHSMSLWRFTKPMLDPWVPATEVVCNLEEGLLMYAGV